VYGLSRSCHKNLNQLNSKNDTTVCFQPNTSIGIKIGDDVWIGANFAMLDGVILRDVAVLAAGAIVENNMNLIVLLLEFQQENKNESLIIFQPLKRKGSRF